MQVGLCQSAVKAVTACFACSMSDVPQEDADATAEDQLSEEDLKTVGGGGPGFFANPPMA